MFDTMNIGPIVFWGGVFLAYLGTIVLPIISNNRMVGLNILKWAAILGWIGMLYAASVYHYQPAETWLNTIAAYPIGLLAVVLGILLIFNPRRSEG